jgi:Phage-related protein
MAKYDGTITLQTKVDTSGITKSTGQLTKSANKLASAGTLAASAFVALGIAAVGTTAKVVKSAATAYANFEQLVGGVETLFKQSSDKIVEYANQAFYTAGMSANYYMQTVTSFSASLLNSLGYDTEKAADVANQAIIDISDNANKMGTSIDTVAIAFQSFARQQYVLLDNLKLGYGGTKTEMERLLRDAEAYLASQGKTAKFSINNLADVYTAINAIQQKLGITGTTMKEAREL